MFEFLEQRQRVEVRSIASEFSYSGLQKIAWSRTVDVCCKHFRKKQKHKQKQKQKQITKLYPAKSENHSWSTLYSHDSSYTP